VHEPVGGATAPAAMFLYSPDRGGEHPERHLVGYPGVTSGRCLCAVQDANKTACGSLQPHSACRR